MVSAHNFADNNTLFAFAKNVSKLINILQSESELIIVAKWLKLIVRKL